MVVLFSGDKSSSLGRIKKDGSVSPPFPEPAKNWISNIPK